MAHLRWPHYASFDLALSFGIFDSDLGSFGERLGNDQHGAAGAHGVRMAFESIRFADDLNHHPDLEQDALGAAAFFRRGRASRNNSGG